MLIFFSSVVSSVFTVEINSAQRLVCLSVSGFFFPTLLAAAALCMFVVLLGLSFSFLLNHCDPLDVRRLDGALCCVQENTHIVRPLLTLIYSDCSHRVC